MSASPPTDRVIDILELLSTRPMSPISLSDIGREVDQNLATCHAVTVTLVERGWLRRDESTKAFSLGGKALAFGQGAVAAHPALPLARLELEALHAAVGMQATSAVCDSDSLTIVDAVGGVDPAEVIGQSVPHAPPFGSVFVAWASEDRQMEWLGRTHDVDDEFAAAVAASLRATRARGYVVEWHTDEAIRLRGLIASQSADQTGKSLQHHLTRVLAELSRSGYLSEEGNESELPVSVVSAPVMDAHGEAVLALGVQPLRVLDESELEAIGEQLVAAAERVQGQLVASADLPAPTGEDGA